MGGIETKYRICSTDSSSEGPNPNRNSPQRRREHQVQNRLEFDVILMLTKP